MLEVKENQTETEKLKKKRLGFKTQVILVLLLLLVAMALAFWVYYRFTNKKLVHTIELEQQTKILNQEKERCSQLLAQKQGEFAQFQYCSQLLETFPL